MVPQPMGLAGVHPQGAYPLVHPAGHGSAAVGAYGGVRAAGRRLPDPARDGFAPWDAARWIWRAASWDVSFTDGATDGPDGDATWYGARWLRHAARVRRRTAAARRYDTSAPARDRGGTAAAAAVLSLSTVEPVAFCVWRRYCVQPAGDLWEGGPGSKGHSCVAKNCCE